MTADAAPATGRALRVTAVIPTHDRPGALGEVLARIRDEPIDEVIVVDNASTARLELATSCTNVRVIRMQLNTGIRARNVGAREARGELLLMLDDDSYPRPGTVARLRTMFERCPRLGAVGGKVIDVDPVQTGVLNTGEEVGSFHWLSCYGHVGIDGERGVPSFFVAEGACMIRHLAHREVGGFFEPYFRELAELDLATRMIDAGWEVLYLPTATFVHRRSDEWRMPLDRHLRFRVRNQLWYFWRHFPAVLAGRRMLCYLLFDLVDCLYRGQPRAWAGGVLDAWSQRAVVRSTRKPLPRGKLGRIELHRGRAHLALLMHGLNRTQRRRGTRARPRDSEGDRGSPPKF